jgi:hypothetical protein
MKELIVPESIQKTFTEIGSSQRNPGVYWKSSQWQQHAGDYACNPSCLGGEIGGLQFKASQGKQFKRLRVQNKQRKMNWRYGSSVKSACFAGMKSWVQTPHQKTKKASSQWQNLRHVNDKIQWNYNPKYKISTRWYWYKYLNISQPECIVILFQDFC